MLTLPTKKKWFNMILSGEKEEEYREIKEYWITRLGKIFTINPFNLEPISNTPKEIMFRNGYRKDSPLFIAKCTLHIGKGREEWGAEPDKKYYVLKIHSITERKNC